ncbi:ankyrin repeat domain-containing protein [Amycolatopsis sp. NPDC058278]|uniref:ankyrin repeat domain-containing protein n=1 Tax=Amycolatopsis sp. NPDC058278 TaxID=3346417 RepID=UPI0036DB1795
MVDRYGRSELHYCALDGDSAQARALLAAGHDPDVGDHQGFTPLHFAAQQGNLAVAAVLLDAGAQVDPVNGYGNSPLFTAVFAYRGRGDLIELLRRHGADPRQANTSGQTPAGLARLIANYDVEKFFTDVG